MSSYDTYWSVLGWAAMLVVIWAVAWSIPAVLWRRNDIADVAWGLVYPVLALLTGGVVVAFDVDAMTRPAVVCVLATLWGLRLATHIARRALSHPEDKRYAAKRESWGRAWPVRSFVEIFLLQAIVALVVAQPLLIAASVHDGASRFGWLDWIALVVSITGFVLEAEGDRELHRFLRRKRAGEAEGYLTTGVWSWSRHPNYAGDAIGWIGFGLFGVAAALDADAPWLIVPAVLGPLVMFGFLRYGSGVPMTERGREGDSQWDAYTRRTSVFWPRPPREQT